MVKELISECTDYDFKKVLEAEKSKSWLKLVSAFANPSLFFGEMINNDSEMKSMVLSC